ncbi:MAG: hypothetical protein V3R27_07295, partial [Pseudomonadales bacterium]
FMQDFELNAAMANFFELESIAATYAETMTYLFNSQPRIRSSSRSRAVGSSVIGMFTIGHGFHASQTIPDFR